MAWIPNSTLEFLELRLQLPAADADHIGCQVAARLPPDVEEGFSLVVYPDGSDTINGETTYEIELPGTSITVIVGEVGNWWGIAKFDMPDPPYEPAPEW